MHESDVGHEGPPEYVIARIHPHLRALIIPSCVAIALVTALGLVFGILPDEWMQWACVALAFGLLIALWLVPLMRWRGQTMIITSRRVVMTHGIVNRTRSEIMFARVHDVTLRSNAIQAIFGSGDIHLGTGTAKDLVMRNVPKASLVQAALTDLVDATFAAAGNQRRDAARRN